MFDLVPFRNDDKNELNEWDSFFDAVRASFNDSGTLLSNFRTDVKENESEYLIQAELPGLKKDDINIELDNNYLTIKVNKDTKEESEGENFIRRERISGNYQRRFRLKNVKDDEIEANYENGILEITLPKKEKGEDGKRIIDVK